MAATSPPAAGGGGFLTRKLGPLPMWVWLAGGVIVLYFYEQHKAATAAANAAANQQQSSAATSALANQGAAALQYGYTSPDIASMITQLQGQVSALGGGNGGTTATTQTSPGSTGNPATSPTSPVQKFSGSGYGPGSQSVVYGQGGHTYEWIQSPTAAAGLPKGTPIFYEPALGYFVQWETVGGKNTGAIASGTPLFLQVG